MDFFVLTHILCNVQWIEKSLQIEFLGIPASSPLGSRPIFSTNCEFRTRARGLLVTYFKINQITYEYYV